MADEHSIKQQIDADLKTALLEGNKQLVTTLRGLKSVILYAEVSAGKREQGLANNEIVDLFRKEVKKRHESAELFKQGGNQEKAAAELAEVEVVERYLPQQMSDEALEKIINQAVEEVGETTPQAMGRIIGRVKELGEGNADGGRIAAAVKQRIS